MEEGIGQPCRSIAYPYGDVDERVIEAARAAGYELGASLPERLGVDGRRSTGRASACTTPTTCAASS